MIMPSPPAALESGPDQAAILVTRARISRITADSDIKAGYVEFPITAFFAKETR